MMQNEVKNLQSKVSDLTREVKDNNRCYNEINEKLSVLLSRHDNEAVNSKEFKSEVRASISEIKSSDSKRDDRIRALELYQSSTITSQEDYKSIKGIVIKFVIGMVLTQAVAVSVLAAMIGK